MQFTGMKYFLDSLGTDMSDVAGAFTFYNSKNIDFIQKITGFNSINHPGFGYSISTNNIGDLLLVGSLPDDDTFFDGQVSAYVKDRYENWNLKQVFSGVISGQFGQSITNSDDGSIVIIGGPRVNNTGTVYIYTGEQNYGWNLKQVLSGANTNSLFGWSIATNSGSSVIAVGAPQDIELGSQAGMAFLYTGNKSNGWILDQKLSGNEFAGAGSRISDYLGNSISMSKNGEIINVSSHNSTLGSIGAGAVYIYTGDGSQWNIKQIISGSGDALINRRFGHGLSNNDNGSIIVVSQRNTSTTPSGAFWLYTGSKIGTYRPVQKLAGVRNSASASILNSLPVSMNSDGSVFVAGLPFEFSTSPTNNSGFAQIYTGQNNRWELKTTLNGDNSGPDRFGFSTAISSNGSEIFIGGPQDTNDDSDILYSGSVWTYRNYNQSIQVPPDEWADYSSYGILNSTGSFFQNSGTGFFNGSTIMKLSKPYTFDNDTILLSYEKLRSGDEILLSSATGSSFGSYRGFCVGVNDANKLYFKYWNSVEGVFTFTYNNNLANKNLILLNRNEDTLSIANLNNNTLEYDVSQFYIKNNVFEQSDQLFLGGMYNQVPWANDNSSNFSGYIDKFFIIKNSSLIFKDIYTSGIIYLNTGRDGYYESNCYITGFLTSSGFSSSGVTGYLTTPYIITGTGITGYVTGITGYSYSGVTGYNNVSLGFFGDNCGNLIEITGQVPLSGSININYTAFIPLTGLTFATGFNQIPLTGSITGSGQVYITGEICEIGGFIPTGNEMFIKDINYLKSLSSSQICLLSEINKSNDIIEIYHENYQDKNLDYNNDLIFNSIDSSFFSNSLLNDERGFNTSGVLLYLNGQLILESGFSTATNGYDRFILPNIDYYVIDNTIYVDESVTEVNDIFYDRFTGDSRILFVTGLSSGSQLAGENLNKKFIFTNGKKLISGVNYTGINTINVNIQSGENFIFIKSVPEFNYYSGNRSVINLQKFNLNKNSTQVYYNGIKQKLNNNYLEKSSFDLLSGEFFENENNYIIYNNTDDFFV